MADPMTPDPREAKLPNWARETLFRLRDKVVTAEGSAKEARYATDPDGCDTLIDFYDDIPIGIGNGTRVRFYPTGEKNLRDWVDVRTNRGGVEVMAGDSISIRPTSSNVATIRVEH